jgi:2-phospho-L-lactate guanylyltransferase (CobY/MobA/RfbA family)
VAIITLHNVRRTLSYITLSKYDGDDDVDDLNNAINADVRALVANGDIPLANSDIPAANGDEAKSEMVNETEKRQVGRWGEEPSDDEFKLIEGV